MPRLPDRLALLECAIAHPAIHRVRKPASNPAVGTAQQHERLESAEPHEPANIRDLVPEGNYRLRLLSAPTVGEARGGWVAKRGLVAEANREGSRPRIA